MNHSKGRTAVAVQWLHPLNMRREELSYLSFDRILLSSCSEFCGRHVRKFRYETRFAHRRGLVVAGCSLYVVALDRILDEADVERRAHGYRHVAGIISDDGDAVTQELLRKLQEMSERLMWSASGNAMGASASGRVQLRHPISGTGSELQLPQLNEDAVTAAIRGIVDGIDEPRERYLALWRLLPSRVSEAMGFDVASLPAQAAIPDFSVLHAADMSTGMWHAGAMLAGSLSMSVGPVQSFISSARSIRDLWSGSAILSWLTFRGMLPFYHPSAPRPWSSRCFVVRP